jgi:hypothetical protein
MDNVTRGERYLNKICNDGLISEQGRDWLIARIDAFHDKQLKNLAGDVDAQTGASVVRCVKQSITIAAPVGVVGNFDVHIVQWQWLTANQSGTSVGNYAVSNRTGQVITAPTLSTVANGQVGGLQIFLVPTGANLGITQPPGGTQLIGQLNIDQAYTTGVTRLISMGFEVHNTTSQLNVQGSCAVYRQMSNDNAPVHWTLVDTASGTENHCDFSGPLINYPPVNLANAMLLPGTKQWEAKEGCYVMAAFFSAEDRATSVEPTAPVIGAANVTDLEGVINTSAVNFPIPGPVVAGTAATRSIPSFRVYNVHQSGAIFSGLSNSTTLTINWNVFLETFPDSSQADILPLATPSGEYDPDAIDLYTRIIADMPVGVPVCENGMGDWFLQAVSDAAKAIGPVLAMIPHPAARVIGTGLTAVGPIADTIIGERSTAKKKSKADRKVMAGQNAQTWRPPAGGFPPLPTIPPPLPPRKAANGWTKNPSGVRPATSKKARRRHR